MGSLREAARDRDWQGPPRLPSLASLRARKARRPGEAAATGRAACELWGLCARPPAIGIGRGRRVYLPWQAYARARRAAPARPPLRDEPPVSYGVSARGRPRSGLAGGAAFTFLGKLTRAQGAPPRRGRRYGTSRL